MKHRQSIPRQWLIVNSDSLTDCWRILQRLPLETGVLVLRSFSPGDRRRLRRLAASRQLVLCDEQSGAAARVHNARELRRALLRRTPLILLSPIHRTPSHPDWPALPRMRAAALARLGGRRLAALGGMDDKRYAKIARLGFAAWAGISAFRT